EVVAVAIESGSEYIVSGDNHLLDLKNWDQISILPPAEFLWKIGE
ncbi:MAG: putative toxin-antitoxin system toxin component, PIN family, partial [Candidatus Omnitrophica bacterium]|nr:putative toxin-antitoxin system toxin component, PIN family [Candidatus Omnitrophota bacterium]